MCTGAELAIAGAAAAAAGAGTTAYAQKQKLNKQDDVAAAGIIKQGALQKQGENDVTQNIKSASQSAADTQATSAKQLAQYRTALQQNMGTSASAAPAVDGSSKAFKAAQTAQTGSANQYVGNLANDAAVTNGTQLERVGENQQMGETAGKLGQLSNQSNEQNYLTKLQVQSTQANPWLTGLGTLLSAAGVGMGSAAGLAGAGGAAADAATTAGSTAAGFTDAAGALQTVGGGLAGVGSVAGDVAPSAFSLAGAAPAAAGFGNMFGSAGTISPYLSAIIGGRNQNQSAAGI